MPIPIEVQKLLGAFVGITIRVRLLGTYRVPDPMGIGTNMIFYLWVSPVPKMKWVWGGYFSPPAGDTSGTRFQ
jgi:hypothetical protein